MNGTGAVARPQLRVRVWDLPTRAFHWLLAAAVTTAIATGRLGGAAMNWHARAGLFIVGLLAFRVVWGFVGFTHARFASFAPTPARLRAYLAGRWHGQGHSPLGALSVFALLGILALQAATGLFSNDDIAFYGPLHDYLDEDRSAQLTGWHHRLSNALYALLALHVAAIAFYARVKKRNLVVPMVTGWAPGAPSTGEAPAGGGRWAQALALSLAALAVLAASGTLWPFAGHAAPQTPTVSSAGSARATGLLPSARAPSW